MCSLCNAGMMTPAAARPKGRGSGLVPGVRVSGQNITLHNWQPEQPRAVRLPNHNLTAWEWQRSKMLNQAVIQGPPLFVYSDVCAKKSCVWTSSTCAVPTLAIKDRNSEVQIHSHSCKILGNRSSLRNEWEATNVKNLPAEPPKHTINHPGDAGRTNFQTLSHSQSLGSKESFILCWSSPLLSLK